MELPECVVVVEDCCPTFLDDGDGALEIKSEQQPNIKNEPSSPEENCLSAVNSNGLTTYSFDIVAVAIKTEADVDEHVTHNDSTNCALSERWTRKKDELIKHFNIQECFVNIIDCQIISPISSQNDEIVNIDVDNFVQVHKNDKPVGIVDENNNDLNNSINMCLPECDVRMMDCCCEVQRTIGMKHDVNAEDITENLSDQSRKETRTMSYDMVDNDLENDGKNEFSLSNESISMIKKLLEKLERKSDEISFRINSNSKFFFVSHGIQKVHQKRETVFEETSFYFLHQNQQQQYLINKYGHILHLFKITSNSMLSLFLLCSRTNVDYQVVGTILCNKYNDHTNVLKEALVEFKEINEFWKPKYLMIDPDESILSAVNNVFPGRSI